MKHKERLDVLLVERGLSESRTKAQAVIMSGEVYVDGQKADKPGASYDLEAKIEVRGSVCPYVSRGGLKLEKALRDFGVDPTGYVCSDSGASTGGFTDCLLQQGARKVFAIDVGYGQLAWKIRNDPRVVTMERTNIRYVTPDQLGEPLDLSVVDVSFISLKLVLPAQFGEIHRVTGNPDGELRVFFRMFHGVFEHFPVEDIDIEVMCPFAEISVHHCHEVVDLVFIRRSEGFRYDGERIADTVHGIVVVQLRNGTQGSDGSLTVASVHRVRSRCESHSLEPAVRSGSCLFPVHHV